MTREPALDAIRAAAEAVEALPKPETDITVAPDVERRIREALDAGQAATVRVDGVPHPHVRLWVDETLAPGRWHVGVPRLERLRREADAKTAGHPEG